MRNKKPVHILVLKILLHILFFSFLTVVTQIGGLIYLIAVLSTKDKVKRTTLFTILYLFSTFLITPYLAPFFGREKIKETNFLKAHSFFYKLTNRNYVKPKLNKAISQIAADFGNKNNGIRMVYLDANFPFIDKFPLLPHLSHNDGKKIDISLIYENTNKQLTNKKPSISGYGIYEEPTRNEYNQNKICKKQGYWQYDFPKYLTLGTINKNIKFSKKGTRDLIKCILREKSIGKLFIESHLKKRMNIVNQKVRFQGCKAVRHDDHIHLQLK